MAIQAAEIKCYKAETENDTVNNGGRMSTIEIADNVKNNLFPDVTEAERTAGKVQWRKVFWKICNAINEIAGAPVLNLAVPATGDEYVEIFLGTADDIQSDSASFTDKAACGKVATEAAASSFELLVDVQSADMTDAFTVGMPIVITVAAVDYYMKGLKAVSQDGVQYTLTLDDTDPLPVTVPVESVVSSAIEVADVSAEASDMDDSGASGTFDDVTYPIVCDGIGTIDQTWTLTFTSSTAFGIVGDTVGALAASSISVETAPINPSFSVPYFTIPQAGWGVGWQNNDVVIFTTTAPTIPVWYRKTTPAGAGSVSADACTTTFRVTTA